MLRLIRSTAFLGTILLAGAAAAQTKAGAKAPASDDSLIESSKPGNPPAAIPVPRQGRRSAPAPVAVPAPPPPADDEGAVAARPRRRRKRPSQAPVSTRQSLTTIGGGGDLAIRHIGEGLGLQVQGLLPCPDAPRYRHQLAWAWHQPGNSLQFHAPPVDARFELHAMGVHQHQPRPLGRVALPVRQPAGHDDHLDRQLQHHLGRLARAAGPARHRPRVPHLEVPRGARQRGRHGLGRGRLLEPLRRHGQVRRR
jgi:hypothetical protein